MSEAPVFTQFDESCVPRPGRTLIVGSKVYPGRPDRRARYADRLGVDMLPGDGVDRVVDMEEPLPAGLGWFEHAECISVLEHCKRPWLVAQNIERLLVHGGTLMLTVPFIWRYHSYPNDFWRFTTSAIPLLFPEIKWKTLKYAHVAMHEDPQKIPVEHTKNGPHFCRTEVYAFGTKSE